MYSMYPNVVARSSERIATVHSGYTRKMGQIFLLKGTLKVLPNQTEKNTKNQQLSFFNY